jgi:hypothetical protein
MHAEGALRELLVFYWKRANQESRSTLFGRRSAHTDLIAFRQPVE